MHANQIYMTFFFFFLFPAFSPIPFCLQLPADLTKMHLTDNPHPQVTHVPSSQSGCSIASDSGSSSLSDIYQVELHLFLSSLFPCLPPPRPAGNCILPFLIALVAFCAAVMPAGYQKTRGQMFTTHGCLLYLLLAARIWAEVHQELWHRPCGNISAVTSACSSDGTCSLGFPWHTFR